MAVSDSFRRFVLDQLGQIATGVRGRAMFGALGIYAGDLFFAVAADETLYLKVDDASRADFEAIGSKPFQPYPDKQISMSYYDLPLDVLESVPKLRPYVEQALAAAQNAKKGKAKGKTTTPTVRSRRKPENP